ncbi:MAG TPA: DsbA family protein [Nocardioidaceae bacterium]|nr:DsbA family protein [Nocardioidaceae bacterium]
MARRCSPRSRRRSWRRTSCAPRTSQTTTCFVVRRRRSVWIPTSVDRVLGSEEYADAVEHDIREAASLGATGVPFFVIDRVYGVSGAQPPDTFGHGHDAVVCGQDGCPSEGGVCPLGNPQEAATGCGSRPSFVDEGGRSVEETACARNSPKLWVANPCARAPVARRKLIRSSFRGSRIARRKMVHTAGKLVAVSG